MNFFRQEHNQKTQPVPNHKVFNRWDIIPDGWYICIKSKDLRKGKVKSFQIGSQRIALFRTDSGLVHALDGYCSHMGVDMGLGKVEGEELRCFFHHWKYNGSGQCTGIPCQKNIPTRAKLKSYRVREEYGFIWVNPNEKMIDGVLEVPELKNKKILWSHGKSYERTCHHHITMINGIDPQHLSTVHKIHMDMELTINRPGPNIFEVSLEGEIPKNKLMEKLINFFLGGNYCYSMTYADGCVASLTVMKDVRLFGKYKVLPELHMLFGYRTIEEDRSFVQPIYVTEKRKGFFGKLYSHFLLLVTKLAFATLQGEDGDVYQNIRFQSNNLLAMDKPIARYISYINDLRPSLWSQADIPHRARQESRGREISCES